MQKVRSTKEYRETEVRSETSGIKNARCLCPAMYSFPGMVCSIIHYRTGTRIYLETHIIVVQL